MTASIATAPVPAPKRVDIDGHRMCVQTESVVDVIAWATTFGVLVRTAKYEHVTYCQIRTGGWDISVVHQGATT